MKAWVVLQVFALLVFSQGLCFELNTRQIRDKGETGQKVATGTLWVPRGMVLGQSELLSGKSLGDAGRPVEGMLITLRVGTEDEGPGEVSKAT